MTERDKFITEAMGKCWHQYKCIDFEYICKCGDISNSLFALNPTYSTWDGFGKLFEWSIKQDWWKELLTHWVDDFAPVDVPCMYINPVVFTDSIYDFLKDKETSSESSNISG